MFVGWLNAQKITKVEKERNMVCEIKRKKERERERENVSERERYIYLFVYVYRQTERKRHVDNERRMEGRTGIYFDKEDLGTNQRVRRKEKLKKHNKGRKAYKRIKRKSKNEGNPPYDG